MKKKILLKGIFVVTQFTFKNLTSQITQLNYYTLHSLLYYLLNEILSIVRMPLIKNKTLYLNK